MLMLRCLISDLDPDDNVVGLLHSRWRLDRADKTLVRINVRDMVPSSAFVLSGFAKYTLTPMHMPLS